MSDCFVLYLLLTCMKKKTSGADKFTNNIRTILPVNLLFLLLLVQVIYVVIRWYVKGWRETRGYY